MVQKWSKMTCIRQKSKKIETSSGRTTMHPGWHRMRKRMRTRTRKRIHCSPPRNHLGWSPNSFEPNSLFEKKGLRTDGRTNGQTNGPTDQRTDKASYRDAWTHLKNEYVSLTPHFLQYASMSMGVLPPPRGSLVPPPENFYQAMHKLSQH